MKPMDRLYLCTVVCLAALIPQGCSDRPVVEDVSTPHGAQSETAVKERGADATGALDQSLANTRPEVELAAPQEFYRVELARENHRVRVVAVTRLRSRVRPMPSFAPDYFLIAHSASGILEAVPVSFPRFAHDIQMDADGMINHSSEEVLDADTDSRIGATIGAHAKLDRLELKDLSDGLLLQIGVDELPRAAGDANVGVQPQALLTGAGDLHAQFPGIQLLVPGQEDLINPYLLHGGKLVEPPDETVAALIRGLKKLTPLTLSAVQTIAIVEFPPPPPPKPNEPMTYNGGGTQGPQMALNVENYPRETEHIVTHEAGHALIYLTEDVATMTRANPTATWPAPVLAGAQALIDRYHLAKGLAEMWGNMHQTAVEHGYVGAYRGLDGVNDSVEKSASAAFISSSGSIHAGEDIAEYIGVLSSLTSSKPIALCERFGLSYVDDKPRLIAFAKMTLLYGLGAIDQVPYLQCLQGYNPIPRDPGIAFAGVANFVRDLDADFTKSDSGHNFFDITGAGPQSYKVRISILLDRDEAAPLGLHRLDDIWLGGADDVDSSNHVALFHDEPDLIRTSADGLVLITDAGRHTAEGIIFGLRLQNFLGHRTDSFAAVPFKVAK